MYPKIKPIIHVNGNWGMGQRYGLWNRSMQALKRSNVRIYVYLYFLIFKWI